MTGQQDIHQEIYRQNLIDYVRANSGKSEREAVEYLDTNCPRWREGVPPKAGKVEVDDRDGGDE